MEFIKVGNDRYLVKDSNAIYVNEAEMNKLIKDEKALADITSNDCQGKKNKKGSVDNGSTQPVEPDIKQEATTVTE